MLGRVHSIDTFSTLDGPGIRTVVFMQGCHLRCRYCQNPDAWDYDAPTAKVYSPDEIMAIVMRSNPYFSASGGGLTLSGGEPLLQHAFVREVFRQCNQKNIHTAVDTSLYVSQGSVADILPHTRLFLADIKHMDKEASQRLVGASNRCNLENLQFINSHGIEIWIRYVLVPGFTDDPRDLASLAHFVAGLDSVSRVDILPYHALGSHKWKMLGLKYNLDDIQPPDSTRLNELKCRLESQLGKPVFTPA